MVVMIYMIGLIVWFWFVSSLRLLYVMKLNVMLFVIEYVNGISSVVSVVGMVFVVLFYGILIILCSIRYDMYSSVGVVV